MSTATPAPALSALSRCLFLWSFHKSYTSEISFQTFPEHLLLNTYQKPSFMWPEFFFHRLLFLVRALQQEAQECKRLNLIMHASGRGKEPAMFSQVTHIWEINLIFNGPYIHLKWSYFFSVYCLNDLYNSMRWRCFKTDFLIKLCCRVNLIWEGFHLFEKVSECIDFLGKNVHFNEAFWWQIFSHNVQLGKQIVSFFLNIAVAPICYW